LYLLIRRRKEKLHFNKKKKKFFKKKGNFSLVKIRVFEIFCSNLIFHPI
jgi:hypothetical protein